MKISIKALWTNSILFEGEFESTKHALQKAVADETNLYGADLRGANLYGANLYGADLYGADLYGADLRGANLYGEKLIVQPIYINGLRWTVCITAEYMEIGCERHTHAEWKKFKRTDISSMDTGAWDWWKAHKESLLALCAINLSDADKKRPEFEEFMKKREVELAAEAEQKKVSV